MNDTRMPGIDPELGEQLSALMDGELDDERSRFLLRRLARDPALRAAWERWQLVSGSLKGRLSLQVDAGFLSRIHEGIDAGRHAGDARVDPVDVDTSVDAPRRGGQGWLRWVAGGAVAASVAVVALMATGPTPQQAPEDGLALSSVPAAPATVAPSPLSEADLRPRLRAPAQTVSASQRDPMVLRDAGFHPDPRLPSYLIVYDSDNPGGRLELVMPYVDAAHGGQAIHRVVTEPRATR